jgi:hypothetical protein
METQIATPPKTTMVEVSGVLENGEKIVQIYPIQHPSGWSTQQIVMAAFGMLKQVGGILVDTDGSGLDFYLGSKFSGPMHIEIKNVALIGSEALMSLKRPHLLQ